MSALTYAAALPPALLALAVGYSTVLGSRGLKKDARKGRPRRHGSRTGGRRETD